MSAQRITRVLEAVLLLLGCVILGGAAAVLVVGLPALFVMWVLGVDAEPRAILGAACAAEAAFGAWAWWDGT
jgi:hypothetical protein